MSDAKKDNAKLICSTPEFRVSYPKLFKPAKMKNNLGKEIGELKYSIEMLFDKSTTDLAILQAPLREAATRKWGPKEDWPKPFKWPIKDGDKPKGPKKEVKPEHKGMWVIKADTLAEYGRPPVVGRDPNVLLEKEADLYPGCFARARLKASSFEVATDATGVKYILDGVQFIRDGNALGGKPPANQMFGALESDEELEGAEETSDDNFGSDDADGESEQSFF